jgi:structural maintenance of chromosome 4
VGLARPRRSATADRLTPQPNHLGGGEKTLSSLSLVFALHHYKPAPLYVMDEIDAALDFKNVSIVGNFCRERARNTQFLIISLRNNMFELADRLIGVYKTENATKSVTINPQKVAAKSGLQEDEVKRAAGGGVLAARSGNIM